MPDNTSDHLELTQKVAQRLDAGGYSIVKAQSDGYDEPPELAEADGINYAPDVMAQGMYQLIFVVATEDDLQHPATQEKCKELSRWADEHDARFYLAVPEGLENDGSKQLRSLDIDGAVVEI